MICRLGLWRFVSASVDGREGLLLRHEIGFGLCLGLEKPWSIPVWVQVVEVVVALIYNFSYASGRVAVGQRGCDALRISDALFFVFI